MKQKRTLYIPAAISLLAGIVLILYAFFGVAHQGIDHGGPSPGNLPPGLGRREQGSEGVFRTLGTVAVWCAAISYTWLRLKKKRRSPSAFVKKLVALFNRLHQPVAYAALVLIAAHGIYFLTQAVVKDDAFTGIAAFLLLMTLAVYGFLIRRLKSKHTRKIHFGLATAFGVAALIHAGGSAIIATLSIVVLWGLIEFVERMASRT
ncbi:hypothetical protein ACFSR7_30245 [Cohnella sp. GCM10020058]|uniref:hypothetical protein n=1 Tax=Cohnella sp. GCM10020058 TaxID=3317330 RepID=UPI00363E41D8